VSEYQYYEFQAVDRHLTQREIRVLRRYSTRATITATRFVNHYEWGNFKGDESSWMRKYFDAFLYCANWGTHRLMLPVPSRALDIKTAKRYLRGHSVSAHRKGNILILDLTAAERGKRRGHRRQYRFAFLAHPLTRRYRRRRPSRALPGVVVVRAKWWADR
jgi:hypothetical protein